MFTDDVRASIKRHEVRTTKNRFLWLRYHATGKLLDVGCFDGENFNGYPDYHGIDNFGGDQNNRILPEQIEHIKRCMKNKDFTEADVLDIPFSDNSYDTVVAGEILEHVWNVKRALRELIRVTKPGGHILITVPDEFSWPPELHPFEHEGHLHFFNSYTLMHLLMKVGKTEIIEFNHNYDTFVNFMVKLVKL